MLKSAHIINFQSIRDLRIDLNSKIVLLSGPSDQGKSAILRAIKNAIFDGIGGSFYRIEEGKKKGSMGVFIESERGSFKWEKSAKSASYLLNETDLRDNCGKSVPKEVTEVMGMTSFEDMGENLHYRDQHQAAFLLNDRGAKEVYRFISKLMGADVAIEAMGALEKSVRNLNSTLKTTEDFLKKAEEELQAYYTEDQITSMEKQFEAIQSLEAFVKRRRDAVTSLLRIRDGLSNLAVVQARIQKGETKLFALTSIKDRVKDVSVNLDLFSGMKQKLFVSMKNYVDLKDIEKKHSFAVAKASLDITSMKTAIERLHAATAKKTLLDKISQYDLKLKSLGKERSIPDIVKMTAMIETIKSLGIKQSKLSLISKGLSYKPETTERLIKREQDLVSSLEKEKQDIKKSMVGSCDSTTCVLLKAFAGGE